MKFDSFDRLFDSKWTGERVKLGLIDGFIDRLSRLRFDLTSFDQIETE